MMALKFSYCEYQMYTFRRVEIDVLTRRKKFYIVEETDREERKVLKVEHKIISMLPFVKISDFHNFSTNYQNFLDFLVSGPTSTTLGEF